MPKLPIQEAGDDRKGELGSKPRWRHVETMLRPRKYDRDHRYARLSQLRSGAEVELRLHDIIAARDDE